jgi:hypothetical protein
MILPFGIEINAILTLAFVCVFFGPINKLDLVFLGVDWLVIESEVIG